MTGLYLVVRVGAPLTWSSAQTVFTLVRVEFGRSVCAVCLAPARGVPVPRPGMELAGRDTCAVTAKRVTHPHTPCSCHPARLPTAGPERCLPQRGSRGQGECGASPALQSGFLTTGPPGTFHYTDFLGRGRGERCRK